MTTTDPVRAKALACLREGRVAVLGIRLAADAWRPEFVVAQVRSSRERVRPHRVRFAHGRWSCTCDGITGDVLCPHAAAVALVMPSGVAA